MTQLTPCEKQDKNPQHGPDGLPQGSQKRPNPFGDFFPIQMIGRTASGDLRRDDEQNNAYEIQRERHPPGRASLAPKEAAASRIREMRRPAWAMIFNSRR